MYNYAQDIIFDSAVLILSLYLVYWRRGLRGMSIGFLLNMIHISHLSAKRRLEFARRLERILLMLQAIYSPETAFLLAAINSYISMSRLGLTMMVLTLSQFKDDMASMLVKVSGSPRYWIIKDLTRNSQITLEIQLTFSFVSVIAKLMFCYAAWEQSLDRGI